MKQETYWSRGTRWYYCQICQDIFQNWTVIRVWGDSVSRKGGKKEHLCQSFEDAEKVFQYVIKRRKWHKYDKNQK